MIIWNIENIRNTKSPRHQRKKGKRLMRANGIEQDFLREVWEALPEDSKAVIEALRALDGREDEDGELTPLGILAAAIVEELAIIAIMKREYGEEEEAHQEARLWEKEGAKV